MKKNFVKTIVILGAIISFNFAAQAQESTANVPTSVTEDPTKPAEEKPQQVERVEVIGSRIKRIAKEGASAVKNVGKESMKNSANTTASDSLRDSTLATYGASREQSGSSAAAVTTIGLRGFGATRTLVLLNGRRLPKDPSAEAVDLNFIPQSAIERIEVLKDGASALYGSDALGGVINIVTKKGYIGNEAAVKTSRFDKKGGEVYDISLLSGFSTEHSEFMGVLSYNHKDKIQGRDRDLAKVLQSPTGNPGTYFDNTPGAKNNSPCPSDLLSPDGFCKFRPNELASIQPQIAQTNLLTDYTYRLDNGIKLYNRNIIVYKDIEWNYAPAPATYENGNPSHADDLPTGTASHPTTTDSFYRYLEAGNRDNKDNELSYSALVGAKGSLNSIWEYDLGVGFSKVSRTTRGIHGYLDKNVLINLIGTGAHDPTAPTGSTGNIESAQVQTRSKSTSDLLSADVLFTGELFEMEHGPVGIATGVSILNEKLKQDVDELSAIPNRVLGSSGSRDDGTRDVQSIFAEVAFPLTEKLELNTAARLDHYSDFGNTINPKLSVKYNATSWMMIRSSVGTGFKAPTLSELYGAASDGYLQFIDRVGCKQNAANCGSNQYHVYGGGNKNLKEEKAFSASLGAVFQPTSDISFSIDGWYTKVTDKVGLDLQEAMDAADKGANLASYGVIVNRDGTGKILDVTAPNLNLQAEAITGIDFGLEMLIANNVFGHQFLFDNDYSYILSDMTQTFPGLDERNVVGEWGMPRWRNSANLTLKNDVTTYTLTMRSIPGQNINDNSVDKKISDLNEFDISANYKFSKVAQIGGGIKNIIDAKQPVDSFGGYGKQPILNNDLYDINGRKFFVSYSQKF